MRTFLTPFSAPHENDSHSGVVRTVLTWDFCVGGRGFEPLTPSASRKCSPPELTARVLPK